jgi:hypothetical protein
MLVLPSGEKRFPYYGQKALAQYRASFSTRSCSAASMNRDPAGRAPALTSDERKVWAERS